MQDVPLEPIPNQTLTLTLDGNRWTLTIKQAVTSMIADISLNDVPLMQGVRFCAGTPLIPYRYLQGSGNFLLLVDNEQLPDWRQFGASQQLVYVSPGEGYGP
jgi:hypothetical protein